MNFVFIFIYKSIYLPILLYKLISAYKSQDASVKIVRRKKIRKNENVLWRTYKP